MQSFQNDRLAMNLSAPSEMVRPDIDRGRVILCSSTRTIYLALERHPGVNIPKTLAEFSSSRVRGQAYPPLVTPLVLTWEERNPWCIGQLSAVFVRDICVKAFFCVTDTCDVTRASRRHLRTVIEARSATPNAFLSPSTPVELGAVRHVARLAPRLVSLHYPVLSVGRGPLGVPSESPGGIRAACG